MGRTATMATSPKKSERQFTNARGPGADLDAREERAALEVALQARLPGLPQESIARGVHERLPAPAPGEGPPSRARDPLHVVHGWAVVLPLPRAHAHRDAADVLLPSHDRVGLLGHQGPRDGRRVRAAAP